MTYEKLENISILFRRRQEKDEDVLGITTGAKGVGKSNYTLQQARDYLEKFGLHCAKCDYEFVYTGNALGADAYGNAYVKKNLAQNCPRCGVLCSQKIKKFDFRKWIAYDASEVEDKVYTLPEGSPLISDELARFALTENWNNAESKNIKKILIQIRTKRLIILGNIPDFCTLDKKYRNLADYWIRLLQRGENSVIAVMVKRSLGEFDDKFHMREFQDILGDYFEDTPLDEVRRLADKLVQKHPCVEDVFSIPPMPQDMYAAYQIYRDAKVYERKEVDIALDSRYMSKVIVYNLVSKWKEFADSVAKGKNQRPSLKMIEEFLTRNPKTGNALVRYTTVRNWINDVDAVMRAGKSDDGGIQVVEE